VTLILALLLLGASASCAPDTTGIDDGPPAELRLTEVASGLQNPLHLTAPAGDPRLFVVEQPGRIRIVEGGRLLETPFLDLTGLVRSGGERGLLGLAFHPRFAENGWLFVDYTDSDGDTRVVRYTAAPGANVADPASAKEVLFVDQPFGNHNGGLVAFGPDGMLYVGMGDGGSGGDPQGHGQNRGTLLGALLRIDVDGGDPYAVPPDNPFVGRPGMRGEVWAWGLRNPWRFAFDRDEGLLYLADVGQNAWEEIDVAPASAAGLNYGWNVMEGAHCYGTSSCDRTGLVLPVHEYSHDEGCSVTGGHVYRGSRVPGLRGHYFYADYCGGWVRSFRYQGGQVTDAREWVEGGIGNVLSFGEDAEGELYVLSANGRVYRIDPAS